MGMTGRNCKAPAWVPTEHQTLLEDQSTWVTACACLVMGGQFRRRCSPSLRLRSFVGSRNRARPAHRLEPCQAAALAPSCRPRQISKTSHCTEYATPMAGRLPSSARSQPTRQARLPRSRRITSRRVTAQRRAWHRLPLESVCGLSVVNGWSRSGLCVVVAVAACLSRASACLFTFYGARGCRWLPAPELGSRPVVPICSPAFLSDETLPR